MADTQTKSASADAGERAAGFEDVLPGFDTMHAVRLGATNFEHWIATNQELTRFWSYRLKKYLATLDSFANCRTSEDFLSTMARAASDTVHDYANEYDRVLAINLQSER
ncbi:hypothetical protein [Henriciella aquimarina]|uniref:hypothetical protein n=1 Tax=Henriciella aquimarina TaxID=545261 RepID=UPI000A06056B|nr:hypothetical protein [Henriciella aquimarina]